MTAKRKEPEFKVHSSLWNTDGHFAWAEQHLESDGTLSNLRNAHNQASSTAQRLLEARKAALSNTMDTRARNLQKFHKTHQRAVDTVLQTIDANLSRGRRDISEVERKLAAPIESNSKNASEIRAHLKGLTASERKGVIADALANGDHETVTSVLAAPAYLTGLNKAEHDHYKHEFQKRTYPDDFARLERLKKAEAIAVDAGQRLVELSGEIHGTDKAELAEAEAAEAAAKGALDGLSQ